MKTVYWDDDNVPPVISLPGDVVQFFDYPYLNAFEVGDQIVYMSEIGPTCYRVTDVQPEYDMVLGCDGDDEIDSQEMRRVTIEGV